MKEVKDIWQFFENLNEYVYATDIETHEIVYMNRKTLQAYGLRSLEDAKGKKCYELLQKTLIPCGMCNNDRLSVGEFEEWHYYNPIIDRYLMLKDTLIEDSANGKKYRVELGVDISEKRTQDGVIQKYQNMDQRRSARCTSDGNTGAIDRSYSGISGQLVEWGKNLYF